MAYAYLSHSRLIDLINAAQARCRIASIDGDIELVMREGLTVASYTARLARLWAPMADD